MLLLAAVAGLAEAQGPGVGVEPPAQLLLPRTGITAEELGLVVNEADPLSVQVADYYRRRRGIPDANIIRLRFRPEPVLTEAAFAPLKQALDQLTPKHIQAYALSWTVPYRVACMSITAAVALGFDRAYCSTQCRPTRASGYFDAAGTAPFDDHGFRPAMLLAGRSLGEVEALIDRGVASDETYPRGTGYLVETSDRPRSVRAETYDVTLARLGAALELLRVQADFIRDRNNVLFYFTGRVTVPHLDTLRFVPGAVADHLTSAGGELAGSAQMSSLEWLKAGATGSYGTVVEPCNHPQKFPFPGVLIEHYAGGSTLIEAYWKSVAWPGEGVFIGEPLARPYRPRVERRGDAQVRVTLFAPVLGALHLERAESPTGPYRRIGRPYPLAPGLNRLDIAGLEGGGVFRLVPSAPE